MNRTNHYEKWMEVNPLWVSTRSFRIITLVATAILAFILSACNNCISEFNYVPPKKLNDGLKVSTLWDAKMDTAIISNGIRQIKCGNFNEVHSLLIYKEDALVLEEYFPGHKYKWDAPYYHGDLVPWDEHKLHAIMSCTKSITSALIGLAIHNGYIDGVQQSIFDYLPDHQYLKTKDKERITIEHLLTMTSGLKWDEWGAAHGTSANDIDRIYLDCSNDPIACILERPMVSEPGEKFTYNGGGMIILGEIIKNASNKTVDDFSMEYLFQPLRTDSTAWYQFDNGTYASDGSLYLTPRDMLKFGVLYLNNGQWNGKPILPTSWIDKSKTVYNNNKGINIPIDDAGRNGYTYSWWTNEINISGKKVKLFQAGGWGGQEIIVFPDENMVVVFTGGNYATKKHIYKILKRFIVPALQLN